MAPRFYDIARRADLPALKVGGDNPIVADKRESVNYYLSPKAGVRKCLEIPGHASGKYYLRHQFAGGPKAAALKDPAVFQYQISRFFHMRHVTFRLN